MRTWEDNTINNYSIKSNNISTNIKMWWDASQLSRSKLNRGWTVVLNLPDRASRNTRSPCRWPRHPIKVHSLDNKMSWQHRPNIRQQKLTTLTFQRLRAFSFTSYERITTQTPHFLCIRDFGLKTTHQTQDTEVQAVSWLWWVVFQPHITSNSQESWQISATSATVLSQHENCIMCV